MRLFYYRSLQGNFGDDLNGWLWEELLPGRWSEESDQLFSGIGTIIGNPMPPAARIVIFSSGVGYSPVPRDFGSDRWTVAAVRGPLSARVLGIPRDRAVADGALLLSRLPRLAPLPEAERSGVVFVPHHGTLEDAGWATAADRAGVELLDPRLDSKYVIDRIRSSKLVIADSMHAAIIADTLRVPWLPVVTSSHISTFKWLDWSLALEVPYEPTVLPAPSLMSGYVSWGQQFYNQAFQVDPPNVDAAMAHLRRTMAVSARPGWPEQRDRTRRRIHAVPNRLRRLRPLQAIENRINERRIETTSAALAAIASRSGYLSQSNILAARAEELHHRLLAVAGTVR